MAGPNIVNAGAGISVTAGHGDPLADVRQLEDVDFVMKSGKIMKNEE